MSFEGRQSFREDNEKPYTDLLGCLDLVCSHLKVIQNPPEEIQPLFRRALELVGALRFIMEEDDEAFVYWLERRGRGRYLQATPIEISGLLSERLFDKIGAVILTSATLAVSGGFDYVQKRLGMDTARSAIVPGHFDYRTQALLYVPPHLPDVRDAAFTGAAAGEISRILHHSRGRAFVLFTSYQQMRLVHERISSEIPYPTLLQGTAPRTALLEEFRSTPNCVLFATSSFWQGVDVPGEQLSCVIIDKLPFAVPGDPVVGARIRSVRAAGGDPFYDYQVPQAAIALKQGFGRLIRSKSDRGVLALLDNRITRQRYGQVFFDSLPDYGFTTSLEDVEKFSMFEVTIEETFAAGHALRNYRGKCENVHGHNYRCQVMLEGERLDAIGLLVDFVEIKKSVHAVLDRLDHQWLNDLPPFDVLNPSAENMAKYIFDQVSLGLKTNSAGARVGYVRLWETDTASATYRP